jgi:hypothetical protein
VHTTIVPPRNSKSQSEHQDVSSSRFVRLKPDHSRKIFEKFGAGEGNRTLVFSLEGSKHSSVFKNPFDIFGFFSPLRSLENFSLSEQRRSASQCERMTASVHSVVCSQTSSDESTEVGSR